MMLPNLPLQKPMITQPIFVWVLAPYLVTEDENLDYYYDFHQSIAEYTKTFAALNIPWKWQPVTNQTYAAIIEEIVAGKFDKTPESPSPQNLSQSLLPTNHSPLTTSLSSPLTTRLNVFLNLCDGDEINGTPGISVVNLLEKKELIYTGADKHYYNITTSKIDMKLAFDKAGVPTPAWQQVTNEEPDPTAIFKKLGTTVIVKPAISGGSMGVGVKSVVGNVEELTRQIKLLHSGYHGWSLTSGGVIAEAFIDGPEFTTFITGSFDRPHQCHIYPPVERVFHPSLPDREKFLSFDRLWEIYEEETSMPNHEHFYEYQTPDASLTGAIKQLSWDAYLATSGKGYTRVDIRMARATGKMYVLEVNAQCGISEDEDYTSIGAILRLANLSFSDAIAEIIEDAIRRGRTFSAQS